MQTNEINMEIKMKGIDALGLEASKMVLIEKMYASITRDLRLLYIKHVRTTRVR